MYCKRCGEYDDHWDINCPLRLSDDTKKGAPSVECPICGGDPSLVADAEKWRTIREKQRLRMRKKRKK